VREESPEGVVEYEHDAAGQLIARSTGHGVTHFEYDGSGRRVREDERTFRWDALGHLVAIEDAGRITQTTVDALGELAGVDGAALMWDTADPLAPLAWLDDRAVVGNGTPWALARDDEAEWLAPDWQGTIGAPRDADADAAKAGRPCRLALLDWPDVDGCGGHSDADVAAHAACNALLSAAGLGDLGAVFGTTDPRWAGASGAELLTEVVHRVRDAGWTIGNLAVQVIGNSPRLGARRAEAEAAMSAVVGAPVSLVAATTDGLGFLGRDEGRAAVATALIRA